MINSFGLLVSAMATACVFTACALPELTPAPAAPAPRVQRSVLLRPELRDQFERLPEISVSDPATRRISIDIAAAINGRKIDMSWECAASYSDTGGTCHWLYRAVLSSVNDEGLSFDEWWFAEFNPHSKTDGISTDDGGHQHTVIPWRVITTPISRDWATLSMDRFAISHKGDGRIKSLTFEFVSPATVTVERSSGREKFDASSWSLYLDDGVIAYDTRKRFEELAAVFALKNEK